MATWYIERIPAAGGASDTRTLAAWGLAQCVATERRWDLGDIALTLSSDTAGHDAALWADKDHIVLWAGNPASGGTRRAHGWVLIQQHHADASAEAQQFQIVGPWWWLQNTQFFYPLTVGSITTDPETGAATGCTWSMRHGTEVVWTSWAAQSSGTITGQIHRALWCAIDNDAPITIGSVDVPGLSPVLDQLGLTCADVLTRAARFSPRCSQWWDHSGTVPAFHACARAASPVATVALEVGAQTWDLAARNDLRIDVVRIGYQYPDGDGVAAWYDIAGDDTLKDGAHTLRSLIDCPDSDTAANASVHYLIASQLYTALHNTPWSGGAAWPDVGAGLPAVHCGNALNLTGVRAEWATMAAPVAAVALTASVEAEDTLSVSLGLPDSLGANDLFELYNIGLNLGTGAVQSSGGTADPTPPADVGDTPGTIGDLNDPAGLGGTPGGSIAFETTGGAWQAYGFPPNPYHSAPVLPLYRQATISGGDVTAVGYAEVTTVTHSGLSTVDDAGAATYGITHGWTNSSGGSSSNVVGRMGTFMSGGMTGSFYCFARSATVRSMVFRRTNAEWAGMGILPPSYDDGVGAWVWDYEGGVSISGSGEAVETLSIPDGEESASNRVFEATGWATAAAPATAIRTHPLTITNGIRQKVRYRTQHTDEGTAYPTLTNQAHGQRYHMRLDVTRTPISETGAATGAPVVSVEYGPAWVTDMYGVGGHDWVEIEAPAGYSISIVATPEIY